MFINQCLPPISVRNNTVIAQFLSFRSESYKPVKKLPELPVKEIEKEERESERRLKRKGRCNKGQQRMRKDGMKNATLVLWLLETRIEILQKFAYFRIRFQRGVQICNFAGACRDVSALTCDTTDFKSHRRRDAVQRGT